MPKIRGVKPDYWTDEDIVDLSIPARLLFIGLWSYACDNGHLQDKPKQIKMRIFPGDDVSAAELLRELADGGRIQRVDGWIVIPKFTKHQKPDRRYFQTCEKPGCTKPSWNSQPETRGGHHEPTASTHGGPTVGSMGPRGDGDGDGEVMVRGSEGEESAAEPTDATPSTSLALVSEARPDIDRVCEHLAEQIEARGSKRPAVTARWRNEARLMLDRDKRTEEQVHACIRWLFQSDHRDARFWRTNIRSMPKLREEYDRLRELAETQPTAPTSRNSEFQAQQERAMARAIERERQMGIR